MPVVERAEFECIIPHKGTMCLLDKVLEWDQENIHCTSMSHTRLDNPLRKDGQLSSVHAIEYGAQAMAIHGGLIAIAKGEAPGGGYLVAVRNVELKCQTLNDIDTPLNIHAKRVLGSGGNLIYEFIVKDDKDILASGKVTVIQTET